jgi:hypothetical protein
MKVSFSLHKTSWFFLFPPPLIAFFKILILTPVLPLTEFLPIPPSPLRGWGPLGWVFPPSLEHQVFAGSVTASLTEARQGSTVGEWILQISNNFRDSPCSSVVGGTHMETELHICYICQGWAVVCSWVGGSILRAPKGPG